MKLFSKIILLIFSTNIIAQENPEYGFADKSIPELAQFEYYRGVWKSEMEMRQEDGTFKSLNSTAMVKGMFLDDHKTFQTQFTTNEGFFSTDIRTYNIEGKEWHALFLNAKAQRWHEFKSRIVDNNMTSIIKGGYSGKEKFDVKTVDIKLSDNHYLKNVYYSTDQGSTWLHVYKMNVKKVD